MQIEGLCNWLWPQRGEPGALSAWPALSLPNSSTFLGATDAPLPLGCFWDQGTDLFLSFGPDILFLRPSPGPAAVQVQPLILCSVLDALKGCLPQAQQVISASKPSG